MRGNRVSIGLTAALAIFAVALFVTGTAISQEKVLHSFGSGADGAYPDANLILDSDGNLYGTTSGGGIHSCGGFPDNCGTVFELSPKEGGGWTEKVLYSFGGSPDGYLPIAGLVLDAAGNLYGTTYYGGVHGCNDVANNCGTVFELSPRQGGGWTEKVLHSFGKGTDGYWPYGGLILDAAGNLYGTTVVGGVDTTCEVIFSGCGTVFELSPDGSGGWSEKLLHSFGKGTDGTQPQAGLIFDAAGNLYGTTTAGGIHPCSDGFGCGTVFELAPDGRGDWTEQVLHSFNDNGSDGYDSYAGLIIDAAGNLYGTTVDGGIHDYGAMFEVSPAGGGHWTEKVLHSFNFNGTDPAYPAAGLIFDAHGNLYGTSYAGGAYITGTVFEFAP